MQKLFQQTNEGKLKASKKEFTKVKSKCSKSKFSMLSKSPNVIFSSEEQALIKINMADNKNAEENALNLTKDNTMGLDKVKKTASSRVVGSDSLLVRDFSNMKRILKLNTPIASTSTKETEYLSKTMAPEIKKLCTLSQECNINELITIPGAKEALGPTVKEPVSNRMKQINLKQIRKQNRRPLLKNLLPPDKNTVNEPKEESKNKKQFAMLTRFNKSAKNLKERTQQKKRMEKLRQVLEMTANTKIKITKEEIDIPQRSVKRFFMNDSKLVKMNVVRSGDQSRSLQEKKAESLRQSLAKPKAAVSSLSPNKMDDSNQVSKGEVEVLETLRSLSRTVYTIGDSYDYSSKSLT
jgi:hypothetical protein